MVSVDVKHHVYLHAAKLRHVLLTRFRPTDEHFTDTQHTADEHFTDTQHTADEHFTDTQHLSLIHI